MHPSVRHTREFDLSRPIAGPDEIWRVVARPGGMALLSAVVQVDPARNLCVGYKDVSANEPWFCGQPTDPPVFPAVLMLEAAVQLSCYYLASQKVCDPGTVLRVGGFLKSKFLRTVHPGDRLVLVATGLRIDPRMSRFAAHGQVGNEKAFETTVVLVSVPHPGPGRPSPPGRPDVTAESPEAVVAEMMEMEARLPAPDPDAIRADCRWLDARWGTEELAPYRGEHVAVLDGAVVGHSADPLALQRDVARARNVHPQRLVVAYVDEPAF